VTATAQASLTCPACGAAAVAGDRFCEACGADLPFTEAGPALEALQDDVEPDPGRPCASCGADPGQVRDGYCGVCGMKQPAARDHTEVANGSVAAVSDKGRKHHRNEDAFALRREEDGRVVAVVCDGVSTTVNPDMASQAAADAAMTVLISSDDLVAAASAAQAAVLGVEGAPQPPELGWPSCTFLAGVVRAGGVELATLGDCRAFWLPEGGPAATLTEDDSWAAEQVAAGALTWEAASASPLAHTITRWLGRDADPSWRPRLAHFEPAGPGRLVLCSDGLWNYAPSPAEVAAAANGGGGPVDVLAVAQRLVAFANEAGGHDNITVVIVDVPGAAATAAADPTEPTESTEPAPIPDEATADPATPTEPVDEPPPTDPAPSKGQPE